MLVSDSYEDIYAHAESSLARADYENALDNYQRLSQRLSGLKPTLLDRRPELHGLLALSLAKQAEIRRIQGDFEQAVQIYERLIEIAPEKQASWRPAMALLRIDMGQVEAGLDELRALAVANPSASHLWLAIGSECEALERYDEAEENLQRAASVAADLDSKTEANLTLFDFYRAQGRIDEALAAWDQAWAAHAHGPSYVFPLYQMMWEAGDLDRAREYLRQEKNPLRKGLYQGMLATSEGKTDEATQHWNRVAKKNPLEFDEGHEAWAEAALRVDRAEEEVIAALEAVWESGALTLRGLILRATAEARIGHVDHAQHALQIARNIGLRSRPRQENLSAAHWALLDELVAEDEIKHQLRHYFEEDHEGEVEVEVAQG